MCFVCTTSVAVWAQDCVRFCVPLAREYHERTVARQSMISVRVLSACTGRELSIEMNVRATVFDLKRQLKAYRGVRKSMVVVLFGNSPLENVARLYDLSDVAPWFFIADVVCAKTPRVLDVSYVIKKPACRCCGRRALHYCGRCRAPYCSELCQLADWQNHRRNCVAL